MMCQSLLKVEIIMAVKLERFGIHTRLKFIIEKSGGIDWNLRTEYLMNKFNISREDALIVRNYDYEDTIKEWSHETILSYIKNKEDDRKKRKRSFSNYITALLNNRI